MGIRTVKPTSPARRYLTYVTPEEITRKEPEKSLLAPKRRTSGRNTYGRITGRHRGGGAERRRAGAAPGEGGRAGDAQAAVGRGADGVGRLHGGDRAGGQPRPRERIGREGGPGALAWLPPDGARHGDEPRRPPDGRRRGQG